MELNVPIIDPHIVDHEILNLVSGTAMQIREEDNLVIKKRGGQQVLQMKVSRHV